MKRNLLFVPIILLIFSTCKKENKVSPAAVIATPAQLAVVADSLKGGWGYVFGQAAFFKTSGIPSDSDFPVNASLVFNGTSPVTTVDYEGNQAAMPYTLTGVNGSFYINLQKSATDTRKCKISKLTADSLVLQNTITGADTSEKVVFTQRFVHAKVSEVSQKQFKLVANSTRGGTFSINVYVTHANGTETLVDTQNDVLQYTYTYAPAIGDHIRASITSPYSGAFVNTLGFYKGLPYGDGWQYSSLSISYDQQWDINN